MNYQMLLFQAWYAEQEHEADHAEVTLAPEPDTTGPLREEFVDSKDRRDPLGIIWPMSDIINRHAMSNLVQSPANVTSH